MQPDLERLIKLQQLLADFSRIERRVDRRHGDTYVPENDSEHSYNLAVTAWFLASYFPELDKDRVIKYALAHDVIEVHAGDTYIYGPAEHLNSKNEREAKALEQLRQDWPDFAELTDFIEGYATRADAEARFVYALDKIMPMMLVYIHEGYSWKDQKVTLAMLHQAKLDKVSLSPEIRPYYDKLRKLLAEHPELIKPA